MRALIAVVAFLVAGTCFAHDELPTPTWCADGQIVPVASFAFLPVAMPTREECLAEPGPGGGARDCGQFDDDYETARSFAMQACGIHTRETVGDIGSVLFLVDAPATFLDPDHHSLYSVDQGLSGTCVRCERRSRPMIPLR